MTRTQREERFEFRRGAPVIANGDDVGRVDRVVVDPRTGNVTALIVHTGLPLVGRDIVVPIDAVRDANPDAVQLASSAEEIRQLPRYRPEDYVARVGAPLEPGASAEAPLIRRPHLERNRDLIAVRSGQATEQLGGVPMRSGQRVEATDGGAGSIDMVLLDPRSQRIAGLVVRRGILARDVIVPAEWIRDVDRDVVRLAVTVDQLDGLPEYRPDAEILRDVLDEIWFNTGLRPVEITLVHVEVHDGIVNLRGKVASPFVRDLIDEAARRVRGVLGTRNQLEAVGAAAQASEAWPRIQSRF